jgi:acetoin:2,6-dichlorophenolindophenol oxidoreductase subunit alpha
MTLVTETEIDLAEVGLTRDQLLEMYRLMLLTREIDARVRTLYLQGKVTGGVYSQLGHEATSVGTTYALRPSDTIAPMHRDLGAHVVRGMDIPRIMAQIMARATGYTGGKDNALHIGDQRLRVLPQISMLGTSIPLAAGAALTAKQRGEDAVALTYVGDGAVNTGDFHEGLNFAAALRLPFILVIENNQWAYSTPLSRQLAIEDISQRAVAYGVPGVRIDGNDVLEVYRTTRDAVARARQGLGPTLIECVTMRMRGHSEHDNASYVPQEMLEEWARKDPVERFERWLREKELLGGEVDERIHADVARIVDEAAAWGEQQPFPEPETVTEGVFS